MKLKFFVMFLAIIVIQLFADIPAGKQTKLGLYITAQEAYLKWQKNPAIKILDVRTEGEYIFVGHAAMAVNIPLKFMAGVNDKGEVVMGQNPRFVEEVKAKFAPTDTILIMCRSGGRSAAAVNILAEAGFSSAYTIIDGFEGDVLDLPASYHHGKRVINGWKNSPAPWTYDLNPALVYTKH